MGYYPGIINKKIMSYIPPAGDNANFDLKTYTVPLGSAVNFDVTDVTKFINIKVSGVWKIATPYVKVSGVWKLVTPSYKVSGIWK